MLGAVMARGSGMPMSAWAFYFRVPDIDAVAACTKTHGGTALQEPTEMPSGEFAFTGGGAQGAVFGFVGPCKGGDETRSNSPSTPPP